MPPVIFIEKLSDEKESVQKQFSRSFASLSLVEDFNKAKAVFIKPNLTNPVYKKGVTSRKEFIENLVSALREINDHTMIYIGEGEGGYNSFSMSETMEKMGFFELEKDFPNVKIINLSSLPSKKIKLDTLRGPYHIDLPEIFLNEIDFSISCPLPKVHCMTKITLSYKNQWGCLPDTMRLKNHYMFDHIISKISDVLKFRYAFLDGKFGLDTYGPMDGDPVELNWFVGSNSLGAFDTVVAEMMGFDWREISYLRLAGEYGYVPERDDIKIIGDMEPLKRQFVLKRSFWTYPALTAFHSRHLTQFVYLSKWAKLVHDIMYTFRKKQ